MLLPVAAFTETSGTFVNAGGVPQSFGGAVNPPGEARPAWKVLRVLGNMLDLEGFDYNSSEEVREEVLSQVPGGLPDVTSGSYPAERRLTASGLQRIGNVAPYSVDATSRRSAPLQSTEDARSAIRISAGTAARVGLESGDEAAVLQGHGRVVSAVVIDPAVPDDCVWFPAGVDGSEVLGGMFGDVNLEKAS